MKQLVLRRGTSTFKNSSEMYTLTTDRSEKAHFPVCGKFHQKQVQTESRNRLGFAETELLKRMQRGSAGIKHLDSLLFPLFCQSLIRRKYPPPFSSFLCCRRAGEGYPMCWCPFEPGLSGPGGRDESQEQNGSRGSLSPWAALLPDD